MIILIKLFLTHIVGDFILQPNSWVADKEKYKKTRKYLSLYSHCTTWFSLCFCR
jgi:hypothetical protein